MNKSTFITLTTIVVLIIGGFFIVSRGAATTGSIITGGSVDSGGGKAAAPTAQVAPSGEVQRITLGSKNFNYNPNMLRVKAGVPVELTLDKTVAGCLRSFSVRELGISQYAATPSDTIRFTPKKAGTYAFSCSMGMGFGKLVVE